MSTKGPVTLGNFSCNLSRNFVATQVARCDTCCLNRVTLGSVSCNLSRFDDHMTLKEHFHWLVPQTVATQVAGKVLHCATWEKFLATLRDAMRKVELTSTFRNDCGNKKIARNVCCRVCYTRQYFVQLVSQQNCETSCKRNCLV